MQETPEGIYRERIVKLQDAMKEFGLEALVLEPGPAMMYLTGVRWGKSERTFALVLPVRGTAAWVLPGFEEMRAREMIPAGDSGGPPDVRVWQEDESPYQRIADALKERGVRGRVGIDDAARFFVFDGIRKLAPKLDFVSASAVLKAAGVDMTQPAGRGRGR